MVAMAARSSLAPVLVIVGMLLASGAVDAQLKENYYSHSCPKAESTVGKVVKSRVDADKTMAASLLRLHFHDCFVNGCDGSVLIDSTPGNEAEKDAPPNKNSLRGFDVIDQAKAAVEKICPGVVSCADIVALAARDAVAVIEGPAWDVQTGRRDGLISMASLANEYLPSFTTNFAGLKSTFKKVGLDAKDVVVLSAAHTIGKAHCSKITPRLYNFPGSKDGIDPTLNKGYALKLKKKCPPGSTARVDMDPSLGGQTFDSNYYANLFNSEGLFPSDEALVSDGSARSVVLSELDSRSRFFADFGSSMEKMGKINVLTKKTSFTGEIHKVCSKFNSKSSSKSSSKSTSKKSSSTKSPTAASKKVVKTTVSHKN